MDITEQSLDAKLGPNDIRLETKRNSRGKLMMALRKKFSEQYSLYGVKPTEENKLMNLGITHIFEDLSIEPNKHQVDNEGG